LPAHPFILVMRNLSPYRARKEHRSPHPQGWSAGSFLSLGPLREGEEESGDLQQKGRHGAGGWTLRGHAFTSSRDAHRDG
ncbi:hypothetical protein H8959_020830, partial [Pygathrix nigripes]